MTAFTIISDNCYVNHDTGGDDHPENSKRLQIINDALELQENFSSYSFVKPEMAEREWLLAAHSESWLFRFEEAVLSGKTYIDHPDNQICFNSYDIAILSAGAGLTAIDLIENKKTDNVFCLVRPPGHHAEAKTPFGFCFFNNCVVAARYWQKKYKKQKVLIFDFDAHHGNGIQSAFEEEADGMYISIHEHPSFSYPGTGYTDETGIGEGKGTILNVALQPGEGDEKVKEKLENIILPQIIQFQPEAIIIAAGFDAHVKDYMSGLHYSTELYRTFGETVKGWADRFTGGKIISILEGGYELSVLGESVTAYIDGLLTN
jgi:acetoin utilization deacetylase AcuC-like enzyme